MAGARRAFGAGDLVSARSLGRESLSCSPSFLHAHTAIAMTSPTEHSAPELAAETGTPLPDSPPATAAAEELLAVPGMSRVYCACGPKLGS